MIVIGLTGSIGMGKSTTASMFRMLGVSVFDADAAVHVLYQTRAVPIIAQRFPDVIDQNGVNRERLAALALADSQALKTLESLVHPLVAEERSHFITQCRQTGSRVCVLDIPLLFETKMESLVDLVAVVSAPAWVQEQRVLARPGMTQKKFQAIQTRQTPDPEKRRRAHFVIETGAGVEPAQRQVRALLKAVGFA